MSLTSNPTSSTPARDDDLRRVLSSLRRVAPVVLTTAALAGGAAFLLTARQAPTYAASSSLITLREDDDQGLLRDAVFTAPPVQLGALQEALQTQRVLQDVLTSVRASALPAPTVRELGGEVRAQLAGGRPVLEVDARGSTPQDSGVYEVEARASTPQGARVLADAGASALLRWDAERAGRRLGELRGRLERQLDALNVRLWNSLTAGTQRALLERQTLSAAREEVLRNLARVTALEQSTSGTLDRLSAAASPARPTGPGPLRVGLVAALLALLLSAGALLLLDRARRRVYDEQDLQGWGVPLLGHLPALRGPGARQDPVAASRGPWRGPLGFLRVNLFSAPGPGRPRRVVLAGVSSPEGTSTVAAALAASLAAGGERVLVVTTGASGADQGPFGQLLPLRPGDPLPSGASTEGPARSVQAVEGVAVLSPSALRRADGDLDAVRLDEWLRAHGGVYDVVLFDTPPLLASPDAVTLAAHAEGLVLLALAGKTSDRDLEAAFAAAHTARAEVLGLLLVEQPGFLTAAARPAPPLGAVRTRDSEEAAAR